MRKLNVGCVTQTQTTDEVIKRWLSDHCINEPRQLGVKTMPGDFQRNVIGDLSSRLLLRLPEVERKLNEMISHEEHKNLSSINEYMNSIGFAYLRKHAINGEDEELKDYFGLLDGSTRTRLIYTDVTKLQMSSDQALDVAVTLITNGSQLFPKIMVSYSRPYRFIVKPKMERLASEDLSLKPTNANENDFPMYLYRE